jgi:hypothetical protein
VDIRPPSWYHLASVVDGDFSGARRLPNPEHDTTETTRPQALLGPDEKDNLPFDSVYWRYTTWKTDSWHLPFADRSEASIGRSFLDERGKLLYYSPRSLRHDAPMYPTRTVSRFRP